MVCLQNQYRPYPLFLRKYVIKVKHDKWHFVNAEYAVTVTTGTTEIPSKSLVVFGFHVEGRVHSDEQPFGNVGFLLYPEKGAEALFKCSSSNIPAVPGMDPKFSGKPHCYREANKATGTFTFAGVSSGKYRVVPHFNNKAIKFHIKLEAMEFELGRDSLRLPESYKVTRYSVGGRFLQTVDGPGVRNAKVKMNGKEVATTGSDGKYTLDNIQARAYTIQVTADDLQFKEHIAKISLSNPALPDVVVSGFKISWIILGNLVLLATSINAEIPTQPFNGYKYPKPSIPFNPGYAYTTPSCPLNLPSTSYVTVPVTETSIVITTLPPVISTEFVTLPRMTEYHTQTQTQVQTLTLTSTDYLTSTTTEFRIQPTTVTSYITSSYCAPSTYLPPAPPTNTYLPAATTPPPEPSNVYLPANQRRQQSQYAENTTPNSFLQSFGFAQASPIKRMTNDIEANLLEDSLEQQNYGQSSSSIEQSQPSIAAPPTTMSNPPPAINIFFLERSESAAGNATAPPADLMNWLLCRFSLDSKSCVN